MNLRTPLLVDKFPEMKLELEAGSSPAKVHESAYFPAGLSALSVLLFFIIANFMEKKRVTRRFDSHVRDCY